jgi:hypothetical protein
MVFQSHTRGKNVAAPPPPNDYRYVGSDPISKNFDLDLKNGGWTTKLGIRRIFVSPLSKLMRQNKSGLALKPISPRLLSSLQILLNGSSTEHCLDGCMRELPYEKPFHRFKLSLLHADYRDIYWYTIKCYGPVGGMKGYLDFKGKLYHSSGRFTSFLLCANIP